LKALSGFDPLSGGSDYRAVKIHRSFSWTIAVPMHARWGGCGMSFSPGANTTDP
jgi:hypothetical protein